MFLRELPEGARFMLKRTGQRFTFLGRYLWKNKWRYACQLEGEGLSTLHHSCHVKPIIKGKLNVTHHQMG